MKKLTAKRAKNMNQPDVVLELEPDPDDGGFWIDLVSDEGGFTRSALSYARTERVAWKRAAKLLRKQAEAIERDLEKTKG